MKLFIENMTTDCDDIVCNILSGYLDPRDARYLQRNKSGLCIGDKVVVDDYVLGDIAHKYARDNYGELISSNVGSAGRYFSPVYGKPLSVDLKTGRVNLPKFELIATHLESKLKRQYYQLESKLSDLFANIAEEILSELGGDRFSLESIHRKSVCESSGLDLKKTSAGHYKTADGKYEIEKSDGFWYAFDSKTGQSVVDCENTFGQIKDSLESYIKSQSKKESVKRKRVTESKRILPQDEYDYWFNIGLDAFNHGDKCVPAHSKEIRDYMNENPSMIGSKESKKTDKIIKAWIDGWTYGNLKVDID